MPEAVFAKAKQNLDERLADQQSNQNTGTCKGASARFRKTDDFKFRLIKGNFKITEMENKIKKRAFYYQVYKI